VRPGTGLSATTASGRTTSAGFSEVKASLALSSGTIKPPVDRSAPRSKKKPETQNSGAADTPQTSAVDREFAAKGA
jgi:hypothetical protein